MLVFMSRIRIVPVLFLVLCLVPACKSPSSMMAKEIGCTTRGVEILDSVFSRNGSGTTWCVRCSDKDFSETYICATNPGHTRMQCREVPLGPPCE